MFGEFSTQIFVRFVPDSLNVVICDSPLAVSVCIVGNHAVTTGAPTAKITPVTPLFATYSSSNDVSPLKSSDCTRFGVPRRSMYSNSGLLPKLICVSRLLL